MDKWASTFAVFEQRSNLDDSEFSMDELARSFLTGLLGRPPQQDQVDTLVETYLGI